MSKQLSGLLVACAIVLSASASQVSAMHNMHRMHGDTACTTMVTREYGFINPGVSRANLNNINAYLKIKGITKFKFYTPTLSIGGHKEYHRLVLESNLTLRYWRDRVNSNLRTSIYAGDLVWNHGINVLPTTLPTLLFPYLGLGVGLATMHIRSEEKTLSQLLTSSEPNVRLWQASFLLNGGIGLDRQFKMSGGAHGMTVGLRGGYLLDPFYKKKDRSWFSNRVEIGDVPILRQNGPYLRLMLGCW
jgi:hypothetical protein